MTVTVFGETQQFVIKQIEPAPEDQPSNNEETKETDTQTTNHIVRVITPDSQILFIESDEADEGLTFLKFNSEFVARDLVSEVKFGGYR